MHPEIAEVLKCYRKKLEEMGISVNRIILYGSRVEGQYDEDSDLDIVVVSDDFKNLDLWERSCILGRARVSIYHAMDIKGVTEDELKNARAGSFMHDEVLQKGVAV